MAETPVTPNNLSPDERILYDIGVTDGKREAKKEFLSWLEKKYMDHELEVPSTEATAILTLAQAISQEFKVGN